MITTYWTGKSLFFHLYEEREINVSARDMPAVLLEGKGAVIGIPSPFLSHLGL